MRKTTLAAAVLLVAIAMPQSAKAKSLTTFLRAVGNSIAHPQHHNKQPTKNTRTKRKDKQANATTQPTQQSSVALASTTSPVTATPLPAPPQSQPTVAPEPTVRSASTPPNGTIRRDFPYGVPVPNKVGFVTSPYAPRAGLVDVRGFPSGTEVKDPYTGKIFLAP